MEERKYDAFISYRHCELDRFIAENIQKQLETFQLPKNLKNISNKQRTKIERVFRDKDELPLASDLSEPILLAIRNSEFLIAICTPRLKESKWCRLEIESFIKLHGREHVLAVLAEGEPEDAFPESLLYYEKETIGTDGSRTTEKVAVEPLAADVRGTTKAERKKKIKQEILRLAAAMFSVAYDDLRQRHRERKLKRIIGLSAAAAAVFLTFGIISGSMTVQISRQKEQLAKQSFVLEESNEQLMESNQKISQQAEELRISNEKIHQQYLDVTKRNEIQTAEKAMQLAANGDRAAAIRMLLDVIPKTKTDAERPYAAKVQYALSKILYAYETGDAWKGKFLIPCDSVIVHMEISPEEDRILVVDSFQNLSVFEAATGNCLFEVEIKSGYYSPENVSGFYDNDSIFYSFDQQLTIENFVTNKKIFSYSFEEDPYTYSRGVSYLKTNKNVLAVVKDENTYLFDIPSGQLQYTVFSEDLIGSAGGLAKMEISGDGKYLAQIYNDEMEGNKTSRIFLLDLQDFTVKTNEIYQMDIATDIVFEDEKVVYVLHNGYTEDFALCGDSVIIYRDLQNSENNFEQKLLQTYVTHAFFSMDWEKESIVACTYSGMYLYDLVGNRYADGTIAETIVWIEPSSQEGAFLLMAENGDFFFYNCISDYSIGFPERHILTEKDLQFVGIGQQFIATVENKSRNICISGYVSGKEIQEVLAYSEKCRTIRASEEGNLFACYLASNNSISIFNGETFEKQSEFLSDELSFEPDEMFFTGEKDEYLAVFTSGYIEQKKVFLIRVSDGVLEKSYDLPEEVRYVFDRVVSDDRETVFYPSGSILAKLSVRTGEVTTEASLFCDEVMQNEKRSFQKDLSLAAYIDIENNSICIRKALENTPKIIIPVSAKYISDISLTEDGSVLLAAYQNGTVELYQTKDGKMTASFSEFENIQTIQNSKSGKGFLLKNYSGTYLLNDSYELVEQITGEAVYLKSSDSYLILNQGVYYTPVFSYENLVDMAEEFVK